MDDESGESMESLTFRCLRPARSPVWKHNLNTMGNESVPIHLAQC